MCPLCIMLPNSIKQIQGSSKSIKQLQKKHVDRKDTDLVFLTQNWDELNHSQSNLPPVIKGENINENEGCR
jgi:hypothetical protein